MSPRKKGWETDTKGKVITEELKGKIYKIVEDIEWRPHPLREKIKMRILLSQEEDGTDYTMFIGMTPKGEIVPEHIHEGSDDILFPLSGKAKLWIQGVGDLELKKGVIARVPKGVLHKVHEVSEDLYAFDVFIPPIL